MICAPTIDDYSSSHGQQVPESDQPLFLERFEVFMEKSMNEIQAFSDREGRAFEQTIQDVARWHFNRLFQCQCPTSQVQPENTNTNRNEHRSNEIWQILVRLSTVLESLSSTLDIESFVLAIDTSSQESSITNGFLGGSIQGREFWRGLRSGGDSGARAFREMCVGASARGNQVLINADDVSDNKKETKTGSAKITARPSSAGASGSNSNLSFSRNVKVDLYDGVRKALRQTSGVRTAEMKWTNHERLFAYGVYLAGWPSDIPTKNPSSLKTDQNKRLLELLNAGQLRFVKNGFNFVGGKAANLEHASEAVDARDSGGDGEMEGMDAGHGAMHDGIESMEEHDGAGAGDDMDGAEEVFAWAIQYDDDDDNTSVEPHSATETPAPTPPSPPPARPRKKAKFGERIRFHEFEKPVT
ncbi:hypothetical protein BDP27DRAFT_1404306 [Rhodocollybia butyracea]|uniref:Uncharacterized protein n=1 Tax=Rhodocollybia butyracea TaxID=206335 RepID=A0A9P5PMJ3_9AGAR|nr:hypothetical protein BDP27DRAFT_1404306 [Rhodocollybia butyracea]